VKPKKGTPRNKEAAGALTLSVRIQPRASKNEVVAREGGGYKIRLTAPPVDGAANEALVRFLADRFSVPKSSVELVSGHTSRDKVVRIGGVAATDAEQLLNGKGK
jgi:uncharacterized protein (TIGR00251 family)